jgi:hypothetical protein
MHLNGLFRHFGRLASSLALLTAAPALALEYRWDIYSEVEYQSNATLNEAEHSGVLTITGSQIAFSHAAQNLSLNGDYDLEFGAYLNDTNEDRFDANGDSFALWQITDKIFAWQFFHQVSSTVANRGEKSSDPTLADTADNRRTRNHIATGPIVRLPITKVDTVELTGSYQEVTFNDADNEALNETEPDSESRGGSASWLHQLSPTSTLSTSYSYREIDRDEDASVENTTIFETAYLGYSQKLNKNSYLIRLGSNQSKAKDREKSDGLYYLGEYQHDFGNQQIILSASQQKTSTAFGSYGSNYGGDNTSIGLSQNNYEVEDLVEITTLQIDYNSTMYCSRCQYSIGLSHVDSDYEELNGEDDTVDLINLNYRHRFNPSFTGTVNLRHLRRSFEADHNDNNDTQIDIIFERQQTQQLTLEFGVGFMTRSSDREFDPDYDNKTVFVGVNYNLMDNTNN